MNKNVWNNIFVCSSVINLHVILYICPLSIVTGANELFEFGLHANDLSLVIILFSLILIVIIQAGHNYTEHPSCRGMYTVLIWSDNLSF